MAMLPHLPRRAIPQRDCRPLPVGGRGYQDDRGLTCGQVHLHSPPHTPHPPALPSPTLSPPCSPEVSGIPAEANRNVPQQWYTVFKPMRRDQRGDFPAWPRAGCVSLGPATPSLGPSPPLRPRADLPDSTIQLRSLSTPIHACAVPFLQDASPPLPLGALWQAVLAAAGGAGRPLVATCGHNMALQGRSPPGPTRGRWEGSLGSAYILLFSKAQPGPLFKFIRPQWEKVGCC